MASKSKQKTPNKPQQKKSADIRELEGLYKQIDSFKLEVKLLRKDFDPQKEGIEEQTPTSLFEDTIKRLELELKEKEAQESKPKSSTENNDKLLRELQENHAKEIEKMKKERARLEKENKEINTISSAITKENEKLKKEVAELKNPADQKQPPEGNVTADLEKAKTEIRKITTERDEYKVKFEKQETICREKDDKITELQTRCESQDKRIKEIQNKLQTKNTRERSIDQYPTAKMAALERELRDKEGELSTMKEKLQAESDKIADLKKQISDEEGENKSLHEKLKTERTAITTLEKQISDKNHEIKSLTENSNRERNELNAEKTKYEALQKELSNAKDDLKNINAQMQNARATSSSDEVAKLRKENEAKQEQINELQSTIADLRKKNNIVEPRGQSSGSDVSKLRKEIARLKDENDHLKTRLSELVGAKLTENNPDIADLSDMNRPQKLGEMYSELYDNEWTDAFEELETTCGESENVAIQHLNTILWEASEFCESLSSKYIKQLDSVLFRIPEGKESNTETSEMPVTIRKQIKDLRKGVSPYLKANASDKYVQTSKEKKIGTSLKSFMKKCAELCWLMRLQDPPVVLSKKNSTGPFNADLYRTYTKSGKTVDFVVWPPLLLHDSGPTLAKGVAQGK